MTLRKALEQTEPVYGETRARPGGQAVYVRGDTKARLAVISHRLGVSERHLVDAALLIIADKFEGQPLPRYEYHSRTTRRTTKGGQ